MSECAGQCEGCAFRKGAAANLEQTNLLRGAIAALGAIPFHCHESLGWSHDKDNYPEGDIAVHGKLAVLSSHKLRRSIEQCGMGPALTPGMKELQSHLRICAGWKSAVRQLKDAGWFANKDITIYRRAMAQSAARDIEAIGKVPKNLKKSSRKKHADVALRNLEGCVRWFLNEAREAKVKIGWLFR